jgi:hypothetical protein
VELFQFRTDAHNLLELAELRQLGDELDAVGGVERVLVLDLRHQQFEKCILAELVVGGGGQDGRRAKAESLSQR